MAPIFLLALGAVVGAWIWLLTQSTESIEEVFQTPEAIPTPIPTDTPEVEAPLEPEPEPTVMISPDPYPGWVDPLSVGSPWGQQSKDCLLSAETQHEPFMEQAQYLEILN